MMTTITGNTNQQTETTKNEPYCLPAQGFFDTGVLTRIVPLMGIYEHLVYSL